LDSKGPQGENPGDLSKGTYDAFLLKEAPRRLSFQWASTPSTRLLSDHPPIDENSLPGRNDEEYIQELEEERRKIQTEKEREAEEELLEEDLEAPTFYEEYNEFEVDDENFSHDIITKEEAQTPLFPLLFRSLRHLDLSYCPSLATLRFTAPQLITATFNHCTTLFANALSREKSRRNADSIENVH